MEPSEVELPTGQDGPHDLLARAEQLAWVVKDTLASNLHYMCSVGVAGNKVLAKVSRHQACIENVLATNPHVNQSDSWHHSEQSQQEYMLSMMVTSERC